MKYVLTEKEMAEYKKPETAADKTATGRERGGISPAKLLVRRICLAVIVAGVAYGVYFILHSRNQLASTSGLSNDNAKTEIPVDGTDSAPRVSLEKIKQYLTPTSAEINQLYGYVRNSPFVAENLQYHNSLSDMPLYYIATNDIVNAGATRVIKKGEDGPTAEFFTAFYGGAARYARLVALAAAMQDAGYDGMLKKFVAAMPRSFCSRCPEKDCAAFIVNNGLDAALADDKIRVRAISYSSGTIVSILAHESGHHALGHLLAFPEKGNLEIDRNQEREADSFASSVISASPFGEYIFAGTLFWHFALAVQSDGDSDVAQTHPLSRERFENFVRANREKAAAYGISLK